MYPPTGANRRLRGPVALRFVGRAGGDVDGGAVIDLLERIARRHRWMHVEKLPEYDGVKGRNITSSRLNSHRYISLLSKCCLAPNTSLTLRRKEILVQVQIRGRNIELTEALRAHAERRLQFALSRFGERIAGEAVREPRAGTWILARDDGRRADADVQGCASLGRRPA